jgi:hypothetical protein
MKILLAGVVLFHASKWKDGETDMTRLVVVFHLANLSLEGQILLLLLTLYTVA